MSIREVELKKRCVEVLYSGARSRKENDWLYCPSGLLIERRGPQIWYEAQLLGHGCSEFGVQAMLHLYWVCKLNLVFLHSSHVVEG